MGASKSKLDDDSGAHEVWTVLPHHMGGGPHGLGMLLQTHCIVIVILIIISFPSPTHSFIPGLKPSFSANPSNHSLSFSSSGLTTWILQTFTVTSEHIRFYILVFLFYTF